MYFFRSLTLLGIVGALVGTFFGIRGVIQAKHATDAVNRKGADAQSLYHAGNLDKALGKVKARVGDDGRLLELDVFPGYLVADVSTGSNEKGTSYRVQEDGRVDQTPLNLTGPGTVADNSFPIGALKSDVVEKLAGQAAAKEHVDLNGVTHVIAQIQPDSGDPGIAVYLNDDKYWRAGMNGADLTNPDIEARKSIAKASATVKAATSQVSAAAQGAQSMQSCIQAAGADVAKLTACTK